MSNNTVEIRFVDGRIGCFSYGVPIALFVPKTFCSAIPINRDSKQLIKALTETTTFGLWVHTNLRYSITTTKHMRKWCNPQTSIEVTDYLLRILLHPIERAK